MGFLTVDLLAEKQGVKLNKVKFKSAYNILRFGGARVLVMKPQTFMYLKLLEEAVLEEKGEQPAQAAECTADLTVNAHLPERYVPSAEQRMDLYRRIAAIRTPEDSGEILDELMDRYGDPPKPVLALLDVALLRASAQAAGVTDLSQKGDRLRLELGVFRPEALAAVCALPKYRQLLTLSAGDIPMRCRSGPRPRRAWLRCASAAARALQRSSRSANFLSCIKTDACGEPQAPVLFSRCYGS